MDKQAKNFRVLDIYVRLCEGKTINKVREAERFGVDARSIQRDIDDIRAFLDERSVNASDIRKITYCHLRKGFVMTGTESSMMSNSEILAVGKILLGSRAFTRKDMYAIIDKLLAGCAPQKNLKLVSELLANEKFHYVETRHKADIWDRLWEIGMEIQSHNLLEITYEKQIDTRELVKRIVQPVAILFSEYYFYLNAYLMKKGEKGMYVQAFDHPSIFRLDRIHAYKKTGNKFRIAYADRFEEGEYRKRLQFMFAGKLMRAVSLYGKQRGCSFGQAADSEGDTGRWKWMCDRSGSIWERDSNVAAQPGNYGGSAAAAGISGRNEKNAFGYAGAV